MNTRLDFHEAAALAGAVGYTPNFFSSGPGTSVLAPVDVLGGDYFFLRCPKVAWRGGGDCGGLEGFRRVFLSPPPHHIGDRSPK